ncbi:IS1595 family transposase, partial [Pseudoalteromonas luteoviolacea]
MNAEEFSILKQVVIDLSPKQKKQLENILNKPDDISCITKILDANVNKCPYCQGEKLYKWGTSGSRQRYRCKSCERTFNGLTGTELNGLHHQDKWDHYIETMIDGQFLRQAAHECGIALSTSFRWRHKMLKLTENLTDQRLDGIVEIDETQFNLSEKGCRSLNREPRKRGTDKAEQKIKVVVAKDRSGHIFDKVMTHFKLDELKPALLPRLEPDIVLCSDGHLNYYWLAEKEKIKHVVLNGCDNERVKDEVFHIQNVNSYHGRLKSWVSRFRGVATKNLHKYIGWMRWFERKRIAKC